MQNLDTSKIKEINKQLSHSENDSKIDYEDWVKLVFLISSKELNAEFDEQNLNLIVHSTNEKSILTLNINKMPPQFKGDAEKIKYVFCKLVSIK